MLFPPTELEKTLADVREATALVTERACRAAREACECYVDGSEWDPCDACPRHLMSHLATALDWVARNA